MNIRRYLIRIYLLGTLLLAASTGSGVAQVLFFDYFQQFANGTDLTSTNYTPSYGPAAASVVTAVQNGSPTMTVSNFLGNTWAFFNNSVPTNKNQYEGILSSIQTNQPLQVTWNTWIKATNTGPGMFLLSVPTSDPNANFNPLIYFKDTGSVIALTNGTNVQVLIGSWGSLAGTVMTNKLILDYPDGTFSYSLNGQLLATLPLGPYFTNVIGAIYFNGFERTAGSLGNRFAIANVEVQAFTSSNDFAYSTGNNTITITGYTGTNTTVIIPAMINGLPVTGIGSYAFEDQTRLVSVTIPAGVATIGQYAFAADPGLATIYFLGDAPGADYTVFSGNAGTIYYVPGTTGWTKPFAGLPTVPLYQPNPMILVGHGLGVKTNQFGFTVSWAPNFPVVVEAATNLANPLWSPVVTNSLSNGSFYFSDPASTNYSRRFYRLAGTNVVAFFTAGPIFGQAPLAVQFNSPGLDSLGNAITNWNWNFGDGAASTAQNPVHTYTNIGSFNPGFAATNIHGAAVTGRGPPVGTFKFLTTTNQGAITITGFVSGGMGALMIPGTLNNLPVTGIGASAFAGCTNITSVTIPNSVTSIGDFAFGSCGNLGSVLLGNSLSSIGNSVFAYCTNLTGVTIPNSVTGLGSDAFQDCTSLNTISIPASVTTIGPYAFAGCIGLTGVYFQGDAPGVGVGIFQGDPAVAYWFWGAAGWGETFGGVPTSVLKSPFIFTANNATITIIGYTGTDTTVIIPGTINGLPVASIGNNAFHSSTRSTIITIPTSVTNIGSGAFSGCSSLTSVTLGTNVVSIGDGAFSYCYRVTGITIPDSVTSVGDHAFNACGSLASVAIGQNVANIGNFAFAFCANLTSLTIPNSVNRIGTNAFVGCSSLTSITIPDSVSRIDDLAFGSCAGLTSVVIGSGVTNIGNLAFNFCTGLTAITIPGNVASIGTAAFYSCSNLASATIDSGNIGDFAFGYCGNLNTVLLGGSVANIGDFAFAFCSGLTGITIPQSVNSIGVNAFFSCNGLDNATINGGNIGDYAFSSCGSLGSVVIGNNVTNIGVGAFAGCSSLTNLTVSSSVTDIGGSAFSSCQSMINVTVGSGVSRIGSGAFSDDYNLQTVYFVGDPPMFADANGLFAGVNPAVAKIYYQPGTTGWSPQLQTQDGSFGVKTNQFGFNISCDNNLLVVVEACTNLQNPLWLPVATNLGPFYFSDSQWRNYPARFYRPRTPNLGGLPVVLWNPVIQTEDGRFGARSNQFGFTITGNANIPIVVEASTNLSNPTWTPLFAGTLTNGSVYFSDPAWANYRGRFYRISSQ
jgi:hypothetical protein